MSRNFSRGRKAPRHQLHSARIAILQRAHRGSQGRSHRFGSALEPASLQLLKTTVLERRTVFRTERPQTAPPSAGLNERSPFERGKTSQLSVRGVTDSGVEILGYSDLMDRPPVQASRMWAANMVNFLKVPVKE